MAAMEEITLADILELIQFLMNQFLKNIEAQDLVAEVLVAEVEDLVGLVEVELLL